MTNLGPARVWTGAQRQIAATLLDLAHQWGSPGDDGRTLLPTPMAELSARSGRSRNCGTLYAHIRALGDAVRPAQGRHGLLLDTAALDRHRRRRHPRPAGPPRPRPHRRPLPARRPPARLRSPAPQPGRDRTGRHQPGRHRSRSCRPGPPAPGLRRRPPHRLRPPPTPRNRPRSRGSSARPVADQPRNRGPSATRISSRPKGGRELFKRNP